MAFIKCVFIVTYCSIDTDEPGLCQRTKDSICLENKDDWDGSCNCPYWQTLTIKFAKSYKQYELCIDSHMDEFRHHCGYLKIGEKEINLPDIDYLEIDGKVFKKDGEDVEI